MEKKSIKDLRKFVDAFQPEFPLKKGYVAKLLLEVRQQNQQIKPSQKTLQFKIMNLLQTMEQDKYFNNDSIKLSLKCFDLIFRKKLSNLTLEWSSLINLFNETLHTTFQTRSIPATQQPLRASTSSCTAAAVNPSRSPSFITPAVTTDRSPSNTAPAVAPSTSSFTVPAVTTNRSPSFPAVTHNRSPSFAAVNIGRSPRQKTPRYVRHCCAHKQRTVMFLRQINASLYMKLASMRKKQQNGTVKCSLKQVDQAITRTDKNTLLLKAKYEKAVETNASLRHEKCCLEQDNRKVTEKLNVNRAIIKELQRQIVVMRNDRDKHILQCKQLLVEQCKIKRESRTRIDELEYKVHTLEKARKEAAVVIVKNN